MNLKKTVKFIIQNNKKRATEYNNGNKAQIGYFLGVFNRDNPGHKFDNKAVLKEFESQLKIKV